LHRKGFGQLNLGRDNHFVRRVASRKNVTRRSVVVPDAFFESSKFEGRGHVVEGGGGGQRSRFTLSSGHGALLSLTLGVSEFL